MLAAYHGQILNSSKLAQSLMINHQTARRYLDIFLETFMVRLLHPWHENIKKRQVRSPKVYYRDSGILAYLLSIHSYEQLFHSPHLGALWEGFALEQIIRLFRPYNGECFFWATPSGAELDLLMLKNGKKLAFEFKFSHHPHITKSMHTVINDLNLDHLGIIHPGNEILPLSDQVTAYGLETIKTDAFQASEKYKEYFK